MDPKKLAKQIFDFYRSTFENTLNVVTLFQQQNQKMIDLYLEQMTDLPGEGKKAIQDWSKALDKGVADFKACLDEGFKMAEKHFSQSTQNK